MFDKLLESTRGVLKGSSIDEAIRLPDLGLLKNQLSTPDIRPGLFDVTLEAWLYRIEQWGKIKITHYDPETKRKKEVTQGGFIKQVTAPELIKVFGKWQNEKLDVNKLMMYRDYTGLDGKKYKEKFFVEVALNKNLKKAVR